MAVPQKGVRGRWSGEERFISGNTPKGGVGVMDSSPGARHLEVDQDQVPPERSNKSSKQAKARSKFMRSAEPKLWGGADSLTGEATRLHLFFPLIEPSWDALPCRP